MIPIRVTGRARRVLRNGELTAGSEIWGAESDPDGLWVFTRLEEVGTPWQVTFAPIPGWYALFGSLSKARKGAEAQLAFDFCLGWIRTHGSWSSRPRAHITVG